MQAEVWINEYSDVVVFVGDEYIIYDKCDRLEVEAESLKKWPPNMDRSIDEIKQSFYKNGFRPIEEESIAKL